MVSHVVDRRWAAAADASEPAPVAWRVVPTDAVDPHPGLPAPASVRRLTSRQCEVLALLAEGRSNAAIAARLFLTERGVKQHVTNIYTTLGLFDDSNDHRRVLAVLAYLAA